jgi:surface antigen
LPATKVPAKSKGVAIVRFLAPIFGLSVFVLSIFTPAPAHAQFYQCVAYAREVTGVEIRGNANTWWGQAEGRFQRGKAPKAGAILAFKSARGMPAGHVAVVAQVISDREILLDHANWSHRGGVEHGVRAIDVSPEGDWSQVRVWYAGTGDLGTRSNATFGFIYPGTKPAPVYADARVYADITPASNRAPLLSQDVVQLAMLGR